MRFDISVSDFDPIAFSDVNLGESNSGLAIRKYQAITFIVRPDQLLLWSGAAKRDALRRAALRVGSKRPSPR